MLLKWNKDVFDQKRCRFFFDKTKVLIFWVSLYIFWLIAIQRNCIKKSRNHRILSKQGLQLFIWKDTVSVTIICFAENASFPVSFSTIFYWCHIYIHKMTYIQKTLNLIILRLFFVTTIYQNVRREMGTRTVRNKFQLFCLFRGASLNSIMSFLLDDGTHLLLINDNFSQLLFHSFTRLWH